MIDRGRPPALGTAKAFSLPDIASFVAKNGLRTLVIPQSKTPLVCLRLLMPAGGEHSPTGQSGLASLTAAVLDEGTAARTSLQLAAATEALGGYLTSGADWDSAHVEIEVFERDVGLGLEMLAEIAATANFPTDEVERLRQQTIAHLKRRGVEPATVASDVFSRALYGDGVYAWPLVGVETSVSAFERKHLAGFYDRHCIPRGSTLLVVGNLEVARLEQLVENAFAGWTGAAVRLPSLRRPDPAEGRRVLLVDRPDAPQTELRIGHVGIARADDDWLTASVLNSLLGGKFTSRLNLILRERLALTYGVTSFFAKRRHQGPFAVTAAVDNGGVGRAIEEILVAFAQLQEDLVPEAELKETIDYLVGIFPYTCETSPGLANRLRDLAIYDLPLDHYARLGDTIGRVTAADIRRCARRLLMPDGVVVAVVGPAEALEPQLASLGSAERLEAPDA